MKISSEERSRIENMNNMQILEEWGRNKFGDKFVKGVLPDNQPFSVIVYKDENGDEVGEHHSYFNLADEYAIWLTEHKSDDGKILSDSEIMDSMAGKNMGEITDKFTEDRRADGDILKPAKLKGRERMLTVKKLMDYLSTQNPDACIMAYEPNSFAYIEQWPELPNGSICTVKEDRERQRDFYLNQWYKDMPDKEKRCEDNLAETYRYCNDDDIIIKFE